MEIKRIRLTDLELNRGQVAGLPSNPRQWGKGELEDLVKSIRETPELLEARGLIVWPYGGKYIILGGNMRFSALREMNAVDAPCYVLDADTSMDKLREVVIKDNGSFGSWDYDMLANEWDDLPLADWGVPAWDTENLEEVSAPKEVEEDEIERKKREFEERMAAGEISEEDEEYQEFLEKFKLKKTTDDCYTPAPVYEKVAQYVAETYNLDPVSFVRPFYPGGDYQNEKYPKGCVVVDNPPFSIMAEILNFYNERGIRFFLFAPTLTLFSSSSSSCTALPCALAVIYENGASVNTSFLTNLEPSSVRFRSAPKLYAMVQEGVVAYKRQLSLQKQLPVYEYPSHIISSAWVGALSRLGIEFSVPVNESESISCLDSQKPLGKGIFGKGYIVSDAVKAERERAESERGAKEQQAKLQQLQEAMLRENEKQARAELWELSEREYAIIEKLNKKKGTK